MNRSQFEHLIRAAADAVGVDELVVVGSQAVLGQFPDAPPALLRSMEADLYPLAQPDRSVEVDGALGEGSRFHDTYGYYAHGVGPETAKAPRGWQDRLVPVAVTNPRNGTVVTARCLEIHDLVLAKCVAGRPQDVEFARVALAERLAQREVLDARIADLPITADARRAVAALLRTM